MNSYNRNWNTPYLSLIVTAGEFKNAIWTLVHLRRTICNKILFYTWKKMPQIRMECFRLLLDHFGRIEHQVFEWHRVRFKEGQGVCEG